MSDQKITQLTEDTAPTADDLIVTVNNPGGSAANRKVTIGNLIKIISPTSDSTTAIRFMNAGRTQTILNIDTTNNNVCIGKAGPADTKFEVAGSTLVNRENVAYYRNVIHKSNSGNPITGTIKITLPKSWSNTMMKMRVEGFNWSGDARGTSWSVVVGGYNYIEAPGSWRQYFAEIHGAAPFNIVRLGHDGTKNVILLGTTTSVWVLPNVVVSELMVGHYGITGWGEGWSIDWITDESGITGIVTPIIDVFRNVVGQVGIGLTNQTYLLQLGSDSAAKPSTNTWTVASDVRLKENVSLADLDRCYDIVKSLPLKRFTWKNDVYTADQVKDRSKLGWLSQDVQDVFPKSVDSKPFYTKSYIRRDEEIEETKEELLLEDCLSMNADQIYAAMYGAIQKLIQKVEELERG